MKVEWLIFHLINKTFTTIDFVRYLYSVDDKNNGNDLKWDKHSWDFVACHLKRIRDFSETFQALYIVYFDSDNGWWRHHGGNAGLVLCFSFISVFKSERLFLTFGNSKKAGFHYYLLFICGIFSDAHTILSWNVNFTRIQFLASTFSGAADLRVLFPLVMAYNKFQAWKHVFFLPSRIYFDFLIKFMWYAVFSPNKKWQTNKCGESGEWLMTWKLQIKLCERAIIRECVQCSRTYIHTRNLLQQNKRM